MKVTKSEVWPLSQEAELLIARQVVREKMRELGFRTLDQTKLVTAASEIGRNTLRHGGGGTVRIDTLLHEDGRRGLRLVYEDRGPGIADVEKAFTKGYTTNGGMGLGLPGSRQLVDELLIAARPEGGTCVTVTKWLT